MRGKCIHLGFHDTAYIAALIYDHAARRFFREFAGLNYPKYPAYPIFDKQVDDILAQRQAKRIQRAAAQQQITPKRVSRYRGVTWEAGRWRATVCKHGKRHHLGYFTSEEEAAQAYQEAKARM